jgi:opacity protein-like surface antigen
MRYAAVELNYLELGELESSGTANVRVAWPPPARTVTGQYRRELRAHGGSISALGILPIADMLSIYARGGMLFADTQLKSTVVGSSGGISAGSNTLLWGGGAQLDFGAHWSIRADFQRVNDIGDKLHTARADVDLLSLGVVFRL